MAMYYRPPARVVDDRGITWKPPAADVGPPAPIMDPGPWIEVVIPPEEERRPPPPMPPEVVMAPVEIPPWIAPPPPDMTPITLVPPEYEEPIPDSLPATPMGSAPPMRAPASLVVAGLRAIGTFMVYRGSKLVLSMAASESGQQLIEDATAMLVGAVMKQLAPGTSIRFHTGKSPGDPIPLGGRRKASAASYDDAWRGVPQEFSYWEK